LKKQKGTKMSTTTEENPNEDQDNLVPDDENEVAPDHEESETVVPEDHVSGS
jgi:hypothetical protein